MTGTSRGRSFVDFDYHKNQEWLRRRKLRLEQVRKQSNEIAKALRQKVISDEKVRLKKYDQISEAKLRDWKTEKLDELERKLKCALQQFGEGHKESEAETVPEDILEEKFKINLAKAQKRGEIAKQEELRKKKVAENKRASLVQRKIMTRKREDLRSALVRSIPLKKILIEDQKVCEENEFLKKVTVKNERKKKNIPYKSCICNQKTTVSKLCSTKNSENIWINLNDIKISSAGDSGLQPRSSQSSISTEKIQKEKPEGTVEFYDFSSRYHSKSFKEFPHLIERIDPESQMLNANELAKLEVEKEKGEINKKMIIKSVTQERGMEALRREKIKREYSNLITKLEELNKKEKILKTQQRIPLGFLHMNNERLSKRVKAKQRIMETEFERIYFEATAGISQTGLPQPDHVFSREGEGGGGGGDYVELDDHTSVRLGFSPSNLKPNSPITEEEHFADSSRNMKKTKKRRQLLLDIDKALKEGRKLRKTIHRNRRSEVLNDERKSSSVSEKMETSSIESSPVEDKIIGKSRKSQIEPLENVENSAEGGLKEFEKREDDSLPASSSTSYKSLPSIIRPCRLRQILDYLEINETEVNSLMKSNSKFKRKIEKLLCDLIFVENYNKLEENNKKPCTSPSLEYYIEKLLNMSRECIANLSVSSENVSTPNIADLDVRNGKAQEIANRKLCEVSSTKDLIRKPTLKRTDESEETINYWKKILEKNSEEVQSVSEDVPDGLQPALPEDKAGSEEKFNEALCTISRPKIKNKYEEIAKKCSERISELSKVLNSLRRDKGKLLTSTSDSSNLSLYKDIKVLEKEFEGDDEKEEIITARKVKGSPKKLKSPLLEGFSSRYSLAILENETMSTRNMVDPQSRQKLENSLESWPDVMEELLKKNILTSPFKWSDGDYSSEFITADGNQTKSSSIKTVIENFRKRINKIKPSSLSDSFLQSNASVKPRISDDKYQKLFCLPSNVSSPCWTAAESEFVQEEYPVESINYALTSLGLNWAKSFLRKNEESRALGSSSNSEEKCEENKEDSSPNKC